MSLNVNVSKVANHDSVCFVGEGEGRKWRPLTTTIAFMCMAVDIGEITEQNAEEWYCRACLINDLYASASIEPPAEITIADIRAHIGMQTNVITMTRAKWISKIAKNAIPNRLREYQYRLDANRRRDAQLAAVWS